MYLLKFVFSTCLTGHFETRIFLECGAIFDLQGDSLSLFFQLSRFFVCYANLACKISIKLKQYSINFSFFWTEPC